MTPQRLRYQLAGAGALFALSLGLSGCGPEETKATIAEPVAPVTPEKVESESLPHVRFVEITKDAGIRFVHTNGATGAKLLPETMGSGVAVLDYDGDGDQDLLFINSEPWPGAKAAEGTPPKATQALYRNDGKGHFEDVTAEAGLDRSFFGMGVAVGDYDNDDDLDLYVTTLNGGMLYRNDGKGHFEDVTAEAGAGAGKGWLTSAGFFDMENDGDLDLFICEYLQWSAEFDQAQDFQLAGTGSGRAYGPPTAFGGTLNHLLRNDGKGHFEDVSEAAGIEIRTPELKSPAGKSLGVAPYDIDGDGLVDLAVANDTVPNFLFHNLGDGKFDEIGMPSGVAFDLNGAARGAMGIDWADFKNDGSLGLAIGNFANEMAALYVTDDPSSLLFSDLANIYGLGAPTQPPLKFGLFFFDYDLDGRSDLLLANGHLESDITKVQASQTYPQPAQLFWNTGKPGRALFAQVGPNEAGPDLFEPMVGRSSAYGDLDGDGDLDVVLTSNGGPARVFRNDGGNEHHWLRLRLKGTESNRDGIGARVTVTAGENTQRQQHFVAKGYLSSVELPMTFGLGDADQAETVTILWPSGQTTEARGLKAGREYVATEGQDIQPR